MLTTSSNNKAIRPYYDNFLSVDLTSMTSVLILTVIAIEMYTNIVSRNNMKYLWFLYPRQLFTYGQ